jgi:hypothetical protein
MQTFVLYEKMIRLRLRVLFNDAMINELLRK